MTIYETLLIAKPDLGKEAIDGLKEKIASTISKNGGDSVKSQDWGPRRLAYEIAKYREGFYILFEFKGSGPLVRKIEDYLNLQPDVIRYLTTLKPKHAAKPAPAAKVAN